MFHLGWRRKKRSYWYLSDSFDNDSVSEHVEWNQQEKNELSGSSPANSTTTMSLSLENAMALQNKWTSWPNTIWDMNFDDADVEIVFCTDRDPVNNELSGKRSEGTIDTVSSCSSPELQSTWELEDLDLSTIADDEDDDHEVVAPEEGIFLEHQSQCTMATLGTTLRKDVLVTDTGQQALPKDSLDSSSDSYSHYFLIEESFDISRQQSPTSLLPNSKRKKRLRFADEDGKAIETVHFVGWEEYEDTEYRRVLVLLLLPKARIYEFVHAEYHIDAQLAISQLLERLPELASDCQIANQQFTGLCKAMDGSELINAMSIQSFNLSEDEILIGVLKGHSAQTTYSMARGLVENEKLVRAVTKRQRQGHTLHALEDTAINSESSLNHQDSTKSNKATDGATGAGERQLKDRVFNYETAGSWTQQGRSTRIPKQGAASKQLGPEKPFRLFPTAILKSRNKLSKQSSKRDSRMSKQPQNSSRSSCIISANDDTELPKKTILQFFSPKLSKLQASYNSKDSVGGGDSRQGQHDANSEHACNKSWAKRRWEKLKSIGTATRLAVHV